jgi:hypothetical protein
LATEKALCLYCPVLLAFTTTSEPSQHFNVYKEFMQGNILDRYWVLGTPTVIATTHTAHR